MVDGPTAPPRTLGILAQLFTGLVGLGFLLAGLLLLLAAGGGDVDSTPKGLGEPVLILSVIVLRGAFKSWYWAVSALAILLCLVAIGLLASEVSAVVALVAAIVAGVFGGGWWLSRRIDRASGNSVRLAAIRGVAVAGATAGFMVVAVLVEPEPERLDMTPLAGAVDGLPVLDQRPVDYATPLAGAYIVVLGPLSTEACPLEAEVHCAVSALNAEGDPFDMLDASTVGSEDNASAPYHRFGDHLSCQQSLYAYDSAHHLDSESMAEIKAAVGDGDARWVLRFECGRWWDDGREPADG